MSIELDRLHNATSMIDMSRHSVLELVPEDDPLGGMRPVLDKDWAILGHEPQTGFPDRCWILHTITVGGQRVRLSPRPTPPALTLLRICGTRGRPPYGADVPSQNRTHTKAAEVRLLHHDAQHEAFDFTMLCNDGRVASPST
ncbi:hypothetical protein CG740_19025 [Streptomyces sp. CB01201]|nr:hypothetical protein CG740_19025 [Streptomyces sp. CB01201]